MPDSFALVVLPHLDAAYNLARWLMRDPEAAEEVVQEAMVRALAYFEGYRGVNPRGWLLRIVRHAAYAALNHRHSAPFVGLEAEELTDPGDDPEVAAMRLEDRRELDRALAELPLELRECLILRELEELSYKEIAEITEIPIGTVMSRLWRARRLLVKTLSREAAPS